MVYSGILDTENFEYLKERAKGGEFAEEMTAKERPAVGDVLEKLELEGDGPFLTGRKLYFEVLDVLLWGDCQHGIVIINRVSAARRNAEKQKEICERRAAEKIYRKKAAELRERRTTVKLYRLAAKAGERGRQK